MGPTLFMAASACACMLLLAHAAWLYGRPLATSLVACILVVATWKEVAIDPNPYEVLLDVAKPFGIPVGVIVGWLVTSLLSIEFARVGAARVPSRVGDQLGFRLWMIGVSAASIAHAIEPVGQAAGWWRWVTRGDGIGPYLADGSWGVNVILMCLAGFVLAPRAHRLAWTRQVAIYALLGLGLTVLSTALLALDRRGLARPVALGVVVVLGWVAVRGGALAQILREPPKAFRMGRLGALVPVLASVVIVLTLGRYAIALGRPELTHYSRRLAVLTLALLALELTAVRSRVGARGAAGLAGAGEADEGAPITTVQTR